MPPMTPDPSFVPLDALSARKPRYWRLADQYRGIVVPDTEETSMAEADLQGRRDFLGLMAASLALAGATGCTRQPAETIMPYVDPPENVIPGRPRYYAT